MTTPYFSMIKEVCVMLIDHDKEFVAEMVDLLQSYEYKVRTANIASEGMSMLSKGKENIDVMIINVNSPDLLSFRLLAQLVALDIVPIFVCDEYDARLAKKAFEDGAYLYLQKPLHQEIMKYLWQFVVTKNIQKKRAREELEESGDHITANDIGNNDVVKYNKEGNAEKNNVPIDFEEHDNHIHQTANDVISNEKCKLRRKRGRNEINERENQSSANKDDGQKICIEWTADLHAKFMKAVHQLGESGCFPNKILEVMNVPGLTRMQISSHLQKCRRNSAGVSKEKKSTRHLSGHLSYPSGSIQRSSLRKFGAMPYVQINVPNPEQQQQQQQHNQETQRGPKFPFPPHNNIFAREESSTLQQVYHPQLQVYSQYLSPFDNSFLSFNENNNVGGLQRQCGDLFGMLGSQGSNIGSTYYRPEFEFNNGDHHAQNDYNLNIATCSAMLGIDNGNATTNSLEIANANCHQYVGEPSMSHPNNTFTTVQANENEGSESNEIDCDAYIDFSNMDDLFQNLESPSSNLPNEHGSEFD